MKECKRHDWRVGSFIVNTTRWKIVKGINIWCFKCNKRIKAYYRSRK